VKTDMIGGLVEPDVKKKLGKMARRLGRSMVGTLAALVELADDATIMAIKAKDWGEGNS
jgi:hypothetical protein